MIAHALMAHIGHAKTHTAATWGAARVFCCVQVQGFSGLRWPPNVLRAESQVAAAGGV